MRHPFLAWDDFDVYTIGTNVAGHTRRGGGAPTYKPQYAARNVLPYKRRYLEFLTDATTDYHAVSVDAIDADANRATFDIVFGFAKDLCTVEELHIYARGAGTATMTDFVRVAIVLGTGAIRIDKMVASAYTAGSGASAGTTTLTAAHAYLCRFRGVAGAVSLKVWDAALGMGGEPAAFNLTPTGLTPTAAGWIGVGGKHATLTGKVAPVNFLAIATNADTAACPRTNAEYTAWLGKQTVTRAVLAKMRATGYDSSASPYTAVRKVYIANHGYTSHAQDSPSLQHFDNAITDVPTFSCEMPAALSGQAVVNLGKLRVANQRPSVIELARTVTNLLLSLHDLTATPWSTDASGTGSVPTLTAFYGVAPDGSQTAMRVQLNRGAGTGFSRWRQVYTFATAAVRKIVDSVYVKTADGSTKSITLREGSGGATAALVSVNGTWQRLGLASTTSAINVASLEILSWNTTGGDQTADLLVWHPQMEDLTTTAAQIPNEYVRKDLRYLVCEGDSLTTGQGSTGGNTYPSQLQGLYPATQLVYFNVATSGEALSTMITDAAAQVDPKRDPSQPLCAVVIWGGTNDIYFGASGATAYGRLVTYCQARQAAGFKVVALTMLPRSNVGVPAGFETDRQTFNTSVRANWTTFADALADVAADTRIGDAGDELNTTYYDVDKVHMNNTGYGVVAGIVRDALYTLIAATPSYVDLAKQVFNYRNGNTLASNVVTEERGANFDNGSGLRDDWLRIHWLRDGFELLMGDPSWPLHDFRHVVRGRLGNPTAPDLKTIEFPIADMSEALNVFFQTKLASGDYVDQYKPALIGASIGGIEAILVNRATLTYQISDKAIATILPGNVAAGLDVRDSGIWVDNLNHFTSVYHTVSAVNAGTDTLTSVGHGMLAGACLVWVTGTPPAPLSLATIYYVIAAGLTLDDFRLSANLGGAAIDITGSTTGASFSAVNATYDAANAKVTLLAQPAGRVTIGGVRDAAFSAWTYDRLYAELVFTRGALSNNFKDQASFDALNTLCVAGGYDAGLWAGPSPMTVRDALAKIAAGTLSFFGFTPEALLQVGLIGLPAASAVLTFDASNVKNDSLRLVETVRSINYTSGAVSYAPWSLTGGPLESPFPDAAQGRLYLNIAGYGAAGIPLDNHPDRTDSMVIQKIDLITSDPTGTANRLAALQNLYMATLGIFEFDTTLSTMELSIGDTISLDFPRLGWKQFSATDPASPDNTATIDARLAVVIGINVNLAENSPFKVKLKVFRRIPGYYPTANLN